MTQPRWNDPALCPSGDVGEEPPPLVDPYFVVTAEPAPRPQVSGLAVTGLVTLPLGPIGALASIVIGFFARREIRGDAQRTGLWMAHTAMVLGVAFTIGWAGVFAGFAASRRHPQKVAAGERATGPHERVGRRHEPQGIVPLLPFVQPPSDPSADPMAPQTLAPTTTKVGRVGAVTTVDIGATSSSLSDALARERAAASKAGETLLVMTTGAQCEPCQGVDKSLSDPLMQTALAKIRLARVDIRVFHEELETLKVPIKAIPGFFLLSPDLTPRDGINGGEWGDDIPTNIAPVLGAFVRGEFASRKEPWHALPGSGVQL